MSEHPHKPNARRRCAYCKQPLPFPFITVWYEKADSSFGIRFCDFLHLFLFFGSVPKGVRMMQESKRWRRRDPLDETTNVRRVKAISK